MSFKRVLLLSVPALIVVFTVFSFFNQESFDGENSEESSVELIETKVSKFSFKQDNSQELESTQTSPLNELEPTSSKNNFPDTLYLVQAEQEQTNQNSIENDVQEKLQTYELKQTPQSIKELEKYHDAEFCISYFEVVEEYGSITSAANEFENLEAVPVADTLAEYEGSEIRCNSFENKSFEDIGKSADKFLKNAIDMGDEKAIVLLANRNATGAMFNNALEKSERSSMVEKSLKTLLKFSEKGHSDSMVMAALILSDHVNFPELHDQDLANELLSKYDKYNQN